MSLPVKICLFFAGLIAIVVGLLFYLQSQVTPEKVRQYLLPVAQNSLQREIEFGDIQIGFFSGITVDNLVVKQLKSDQNFISVGNVRFRYQFLPLLTGRIVIDQVLLEKPEIEVTRSAAGTFNFDDLIPTAKTSGSGHKGDDNKQKENTGFGLLSLLVKEISIKNGFLKFNDKYKNPRAPYRYIFEKLNFNARDLTLEGAFPIDLSIVINGANLDISGKYDISGRSGELMAHLESLDLVPLAPYYRELLPGKLGAARASLNIDIELMPQELKSTGRITFENVDFSFADIADAAFENASVSGEYNLTYFPQKQRLELSTLLARFNDIEFAVEGAWDFSSPRQDENLVLSFEKLDLRRLMQEVPQGLTKKLQKYSFAGSIDGRIELSTVAKGTVGGLRSAQLSLDQVQASAEGVRIGATGMLTFSDRKLITEDLSLLYGDQILSLDLSAEYQTDKLWKGQFNLSSDQINLNDLAGEQSSAEGRAVIQAEGSEQYDRQSAVEEPDPINLPLELQGQLHVNKLLFRQLTTEKLQAELTLKGNVLRVDSMKARLGGGYLQAQATVDLGIRGFAYKGQATLDRAEMTDVMSGLFPEMRGRASGLLYWENRFSGRGIHAASLKRNLLAQGTVNVEDGYLQDLTVLNALADYFAEEDLRSVRFQLYTGQYEIRGGRTGLSGHLESSRIRLAHQGWVDFEANLDEQATVRIAPDLVSKATSSQTMMTLFTDRDGWGMVPLRIGGNIDRPRVALDTRAVEQLAIDRAKQEAGRKLLKKISPETPDGQNDSVQKLLDSTLDKLFGK